MLLMNLSALFDLEGILALSVIAWDGVARVETADLLNPNAFVLSYLGVLLKGHKICYLHLFFALKR